MRFLLAILVMMMIAVASAATTTTTTETQLRSMFTTFMTKHNKKYESEEFFKRFDIFKSNVEVINRINSEGRSFTVGINQFADLTNDEYKQLLSYKPIRQDYIRSKNIPKFLRNFNASMNVDLPTEVDWRDATKNPANMVAVNPVKDQGQCGSCWAFSSTASIEVYHAIATKQLVSLSEQQMVSCAGSYGNWGCFGGDMDAAFRYVIGQGKAGQCTEQSYPYSGYGLFCKSSSCQTGATISAYHDIPVNNEAAIQQVIGTLGSVTIAIEADQQSFQFYSGGVFDDASCGTNTDHGVAIVGYGVDNGTPYFTVRNSWGSSWGENGYIRMKMGDNVCGLASSPSYPQV